MKTLALLGWMLGVVPALSLSEEMYTRSYMGSEQGGLWIADIMFKPTAPGENPFRTIPPQRDPSEIQGFFRDEFNLELPEGSEFELFLGPGFSQTTIRLRSHAEDHGRLRTGLMRVGWLEHQNQFELRWISFAADGPEAELGDDDLIQRWREGGGETIGSVGVAGKQGVRITASLGEDHPRVVVEQQGDLPILEQEERDKLDDVFVAPTPPPTKQNGDSLELRITGGPSSADGATLTFQVLPDTSRIVQRRVLGDKLIVTLVLVLSVEEGQQP